MAKYSDTGEIFPIVLPERRFVSDPRTNRANSVETLRTFARANLIEFRNYVAMFKLISLGTEHARPRQISRFTYIFNSLSTRTISK